MADGSFVTYYRTSTSKQTLGIEAQMAAVATYLNGRTHTVVGTFKEHESGKSDHRPELAKAIDRCKATGARLIVAKLDRLSRDLHFITGLQKAGISFVCADTPEMDEFTAHIFAAMAQRERKLISSRTQDGLKALRERGVTKSGKAVILGNPKNGSEEQTQAAAEGRKAAADSRTTELVPTIKKLRLRGCTTNKALAEMLNFGRIKTARGKEWDEPKVSRLIKRARALSVL